MLHELIERKLEHLAADASALCRGMDFDLHLPTMGIGDVDQPVEPEMANHLPSGLGNV